MSLQRAVEIALERNLGLTVERIHVAQAKDRITQELGAFDPLFGVQAAKSSKDNLVASRFYPTGLYVEQEHGYGASVEGRVFGGGRFSVGLDYKELTSTSNTQTLSPQFSVVSQMTFAQPLLRDFGVGVSKARIRVAERGHAVAQRTLEQRIAETVQQVEEAYWNVVFQRQDMAWKKSGEEFARELVTRSETLVRAGLSASVGVFEARAGVAARADSYIQSQAEVGRYEDQLKLLLHFGFSDTSFTALDNVTTDANPVDLAASLRTALQRRPEILSLQEELAQKRIEAQWAGNQTRPRLDLTAQLGTNGLSGQPNQTCVDPTSDLCIPVGDNLGASVFAGRTEPGDAFGNPRTNWSIGVRFQRPFTNRAADAQLSQATLAVREVELRLTAARDRVEAEVREAVRQTLSARGRVAAARDVVSFASEQLTAGRQRLVAGLTTNYDVFQMLDEADKAQTAEIKATRDYAVGLGRIRLAEGTLLDKYNIDVTMAIP